MTKALYRKLIGFTGLAGSGKTTAAQHLVNERGYVRVRVAGPLRAMLAAIGLTDAELDGERKELPCALLCGKSPRWAMQTIGSDWGRELIGPDIWTRAWRLQLDKLHDHTNVVVDDIRYPNEADAVRAAGGHIVRIVRNVGGEARASAGSHVTETAMAGISYSIEIQNDGDIASFLAKIDQVSLDVGWANAANLKDAA